MKKVRDLINEPYDKICIYIKGKGFLSDRTSFTEEELKACLDCDAEIEDYEDYLGLDENDEPITMVIRLLNVYMEDKNADY